MGMPLQWHKRHAIGLAAQLPDNTADALLVIAALKDLVEGFLGDQAEEEQAVPAPNVLPFGR